MSKGMNIRNEPGTQRLQGAHSFLGGKADGLRHVCQKEPFCLKENRLLKCSKNAFPALQWLKLHLPIQ